MDVPKIKCSTFKKSERRKLCVAALIPADQKSTMKAVYDEQSRRHDFCTESVALNRV